MDNSRTPSCNHLQSCHSCREWLFTLPALRAGAGLIDADPPWILEIEGVITQAEDSDVAAPLIADAWQAKKPVKCSLADTDSSSWTAMLGLAARVNRILEARGWPGPWWVPSQDS